MKFSSLFLSHVIFEERKDSLIGMPRQPLNLILYARKMYLLAVLATAVHAPNPTSTNQS